MGELDRVVEAWRRTDRAGRPAVLATVTQVAGSTYRRFGARMMFLEHGETIGFVSGGCLEADLALRSKAVFESGRTETVVYDMRSSDELVWGLGLGCAGEVRVLLERLDPGGAAWLDFAGECARDRREVVIATVTDVAGNSGLKLGHRITLGPRGDVGPGSAVGAPRERLEPVARRALERRESSTADGLLVEYLSPPIALLVFGAGQDVLPLVRLAEEVGWSVTRLDRLPAAAPKIDLWTAVVIMTHRFLDDVELLAHVLPTEAAYVGLLGPRARAEALLAQLAQGQSKPSATALRRLYAPVGLDIGSDGPEEIALAIVSEIRAVLSGRCGGFLRDSRKPLHGDRH